MLKKIDEELEIHNLTIVELVALKPIASTYTISIFQPLEDLSADENEIKNTNSASITNKYNRYFEKVYNDNIRLVLTPEYSCPWDVLISTFDTKFPKLGSIWVLGCESITIDRIEDIRNSLTENVVFIYEELESELGRNFLDPVVYCFNARDEQGNIKKVVTVQFKSDPMVDHELEIERDHMISGKTRYIIRNDVSSIYLTALICAESTNFDFRGLGNNSFLVPHLQLNIKPYHPSFMDYRTQTFKNRDNIEYICVNWAEGFKINGGIASQYGGSAIYIKSEHVKKNDVRINNNHEKGIYYSYAKGQQYNIYSLTYREHVFYLKSNQINQDTGAIINQRRHGIEALNTYTWISNTWSECSYPCNDKWRSYLLSQGFFERLNFLTPYKSLTKERFLSITSGKKLNRIEWQEVKSLESFKVNTEEESNSLSEFCDPRNNQNLIEVVGRINWLHRNILSNSDITYPVNFSDIQGVDNFVVHEELANSHVNISFPDGTSPATFVGLGDISSEGAQRVFDNIAIAIGSARKRLIIWYKSYSGSIESKHDNEPQIDGDFTESPVSIMREGE